MLGFDAINEFASFVHWASMFPLYMFVTILYRSVSSCFGGEPPRGIPSFFFVLLLYVATIRAGGYAKTSMPCLHTIKCMQVRGVDR